MLNLPWVGIWFDMSWNANPTQVTNYDMSCSTHSLLIWVENDFKKHVELRLKINLGRTKKDVKIEFLHTLWDIAGKNTSSLYDKHAFWTRNETLDEKSKSKNMSLDKNRIIQAWKHVCCCILFQLLPLFLIVLSCHCQSVVIEPDF